MPRRSEEASLSFWERVLSWFSTDLGAWSADVDSPKLPAWIAFVSGLALFTQMAVLRWHASLFAVFSFYKNFSLLSAFLGLGMGYAIGKRRAVRPGHTVLFLLLQLGFFLGVKAVGWQHLLKNPVPELLTMGLENAEGFSPWFGVLGFLCITYVLNVLAFIPLGQLAGALMGRMPGLQAYSANLLGSIAGVLAFSVLCFAWTPPGVWFALACAALFGLVALADRLRVGLAVGGMVFCLFCAYEPGVGKTLFSPYQALTVKPVNDETRVTVAADHLFFQNTLDLSREQKQNSTAAQRHALRYDLPYQLLKEPKLVLVVGAGTGNDVAAALRRGVAQVDAVEIDPAILSIGRELHPEKPYSDARVTVHTQDARTFIRQSKHDYDAIVFGLLDSHTVMGSTNLRLDSFVYTLESFREARSKLSPNGILALSFCLISRNLGRKLYGMLQDAFDGKAPVVLQSGYDGGVLFLAGPGVDAAATGSLPLPDLASMYARLKGEAPSATDDRPFFYLTSARYPWTYAAVAGVLALLSFIVLALRVPMERRAGVAASSVRFFFLGAGFMLLETLAIARAGWAFGSTWYVTAVVVVGALGAAWVSCFVAQRFSRFPAWAGFAGVALCLGAAGWFGGSLVERPWAVMVLALAPLVFSGLVFSTALRDHGALPLALAANLFGAVCGGLLEFHSLVFGLTGMLGMAFAFYAAAAAAHYWPREKVVARGKLMLRKLGKTG